MSRTITIYLASEDEGIKQMILDLKKSRHPDNHFVGRSESEIARMILSEGVTRQHTRLCKSGDNPSSKIKGSGHGTTNRRPT